MELPSPQPGTLIAARLFVFFQTGPTALFLLLGVEALISGDASPGVARRNAVMMPLVLVALIVTVLLGIGLGRGRPGVWAGAVALQVTFAGAFCWIIYWALTEPSQESMLAFSGIVIGGPLVLMTLAGLLLLVIPPTARYCLRRQHATV